MAEQTTGVETVAPIPQVKAPTIAQVPTTPVTTQTPFPTAQSVYSTDNLKSMLSKVDMSNPYSLYTAFMQSPAIIAAQQASQQTQQDIYGVQQGLRSTTSALQAQNEAAYGTTGASINLIGKQIGRATNLASNQLAALGETLSGQQATLSNLTQTAQAYYGIAQSERAKIEDLMAQTGGDAGIKWSDSYKDALKKAKKWEKKQLKKADKDAMKKELKKLGISTSGLSRRELDKLYTNYFKEQAQQKAASLIVPKTFDPWENANDTQSSAVQFNPSNPIASYYQTSTKNNYGTYFSNGQGYSGLIK